MLLVVFSLPLDRQICVVVFLSCFDIDITALGSLCVKNEVYDFTISAFFHFFLSVCPGFIHCCSPYTPPDFHLGDVTLLKGEGMLHSGKHDPDFRK